MGAKNPGVFCLEERNILYSSQLDLTSIAGKGQRDDEGSSPNANLQGPFPNIRGLG